MDNVDACESELWETTDSEDETTDVPGDELHKEGESESLSDIDDAEIGSYLNNDKEKNFKKKIWEMMNQEYLQEQAAKRVAAANVTNSKTVFSVCVEVVILFIQESKNLEVIISECTWVLELCNQQ
ncbi:hypothetical protein BVRB_3g052010 isoform B [Beta vulgaris subsp. vulgaris]|nr:hypothetical protein BVRB_3g052010 isoform B [Beta vulgaris subsp. vulgaris]